MQRIAKLLHITTPQAHDLFRVPEGYGYSHDYRDGWHSVATDVHDPEWSAETSVNPEHGKIMYHFAWGKPKSGNALHTVRSLITARDLGYKSAHINVALGGKSGSGAYVYPRLGFTGDASSLEYPETKKLLQSRGVSRYHDLVNDANREWWRNSHQTLHKLHFDLHPNSDSFRRLRAYLEERATKA